MHLWYTVYPSFVGEWTILAGEDGLRQLCYGVTSVEASARRDDRKLKKWFSLLDDWVAGRLDEPGVIEELGLLADPRFTPFQRDVLRSVCRIPRGMTKSYRELAVEIGKPRAARAVGQAVAGNPFPLLIPCHRVVPSSGGVGNYTAGPGRFPGVIVKQKLLEHEQRQVGLK